MSKQKSPPFVMITKEVLDAPAWKAMSHGARSLYVALKRRYSQNFKNNGHIHLSQRKAIKEIGAGFSEIGRWFRELQYYGFIVMVTPGHLGVEGRGRAPRWRLTESPYLGERPTRDFDRWDGTPFQQKRSAKHYITRRQNPGPHVRSTVDHPSGPAVDHPSGPHSSPSGPPVQTIEPRRPGPPVRAITSLTTPGLEPEARGSIAAVSADGLSP